MNTISHMIATLSDEEKKSFISQLKQKNKRRDTKNIQLFKLLETHPERKNIDILIYGKKSKGAFHALCKRLSDSLIDFIATKSFDGEKSEEMEILKLLLASRIFFEQKQYKIAFKTLKKAESRAKNDEFFGILNEIYYTRIQYAHLDQKTSLDSLIQDFRINKKAFQQEENLNLFYANIQDKLTYKKADITQTIQESLSRFDISVNTGLTFRSLYKILEINNQAANVTQNFYSILPFIEKVNKQLEAKERHTEKHLFYQIQIIYYVANSYFRNKNFKTSQWYLDRMEKQMHAQKDKYHKRFFPQLLLLKILNLNYSGKAADAIKALEQFDYYKYRHQVGYILDLKLSLVVFYFQQARYKEALSLFKESQHSDNWYAENAGIIWVIKKNLTEILLYMELDHMDLVESRLKSFRKKHGTYLKNNNEHRVLDFLSLATKYYYNTHTLNTASFMEKILTSLEVNSPEQEDIFVMSFYAWLKARVLNANLYETTLQVVNQSKAFTISD
ncbi:hypothetical protein GCM10022393_37670 [Aquimarina addita]|uniref:Tetratricopeptide repeat protein n=1 Tax=Aquimarina addita TaxID=870485 RepID=A0ABP6UVS9_9FLAO